MKLCLVRGELKNYKAHTKSKGPLLGHGIANRRMISIRFVPFAGGRQAGERGSEWPCGDTTTVSIRKGEKLPWESFPCSSFSTFRNCTMYSRFMKDSGRDGGDDPMLRRPLYDYEATRK